MSITKINFCGSSIEINSFYNNSAGVDYINMDNSQTTGLVDVENRKNNLRTRGNYGSVTDEMNRSLGARRAVFVNSETIQIIGNEIFDWVEPLNMKKIRAMVIPWMKERGYLRGGYKNGDREWDNIAITAKGIQDGLRHGSGPEKIQVFGVLPEIIENGVYIGTTSGRARQQKMKRHIFAAKVDIGNKPMLVGFIITEDPNGRRFYDHELTEIKNLDGRPSQGGAGGSGAGAAFRTHQDTGTEPDSIINIVKNGLAVNT